MLGKKYKYAETEKKLQKFWEENNIYSFKMDDDREIYSIDTPPPTVSGKLHIGHIFSYTQAEMIARYQRMQGKNVFYPFGFDDNGLPTERLVERELGIIARDMPRSEFIEKCLETTEKYEKIFKELWQSLGFSVDWNLEYKTISPLAQRISQKSFIDLVKKEKAYAEDSPVLWCTHCRTSIAQAELESKDIDSTFNWIPFYIEDETVYIATTRPELLYGCVALFVHPEDSRYTKYIGKKAKVPLYDFDVPVLADENAQIDKGTGIVMCCTFGDTVDLEWYKKYDLPYKKVIGSDGTIDENVPYISGFEINWARKEIIRILSDNDLLIKSETIVHAVSTHERCGSEIEIIPSRQWYIDILSSKEDFLKAADEINWYPEYMKNRYITWVENLKWNWCISRQRFFGVPFPLWYCSECGKYILAREEDLPINPLEDSPREKCSCGCQEFIPETAVLDTWATSSVTPLINAKWNEEGDMSEKLLPMSMRTQAHEIIRTWAFYTIVKSIYNTGQIPWKDIMVCGFVLAKKGEKISKSKKNSRLSPPELIKEYSADAVRYWSATAKLGTDTMFSEDELKNSKRFMTKLWNAAKFTLMHLKDYEGAIPEYILPADRWIIEKYNDTARRASDSLNKYEIGISRQIIDDFFWKDYCDNYLELVKDRLYKPEIYGEKNRISAQYALYKVCLGILKLYAIYVPHITEEIFSAYFVYYEDTISLHEQLWEQADTIDENILSFGETLKKILMEARKYKSERNMSLKESINKIEVVTDNNINHLMETMSDLVACTKTKEIIIEEGSKTLVRIN
ncbi:valine--tRNA ligase [Wukongibacter baidiensis]|uniref:valine--tRNA ligase n=1 Tax=Wukongibacter baidiensis TaxID=1723361 RepID=UPI003D7FEC42